MAKATGKRGQRTKADDALSRKATHHHDFVGQADHDREQSRERSVHAINPTHYEAFNVYVPYGKVQQISGVAEPPRPAPAPERPTAEQPRPAPAFEIPKSLREGIDLLRRRGPEALEALRQKAEERLESMPSPVKSAVRLTERAVGLALWPVRAGARLVGRVLETPVALVRILIGRRTA